MDTDEKHDDPTELSAASCEPLAVCMICWSEFSVDVLECEKCQVPLSVVRKCPGCSRIVSARHSKCVHCGYVFVVRPMSATSTTQRKTARGPAPMRALRAAVVSIGAFTIVFSLVFYITRKLDHRTAPRILSRIASSYALRRAPIYPDASLAGAPIGHVDATGTVEVVDFATAGSTALWWRVRSNSIGGFVRPVDFAPPKALDAEKGHTLLRSAILAAEEPERLLMAFDAVQYYRNTFPASGHSDALIFLVAEQGRRVAAKSGDGELLSRTRDAYSQLTSSGEFAEKARHGLEQLPRPEQLRGRTHAKPTADVQIIGGDVRRQSSVNPPHTVTLLNQEELSVQLPPIPHVTKGITLSGTVLQDRSRRDHDAVPAGSPCVVKVVEAVVPLSLGSDGSVVVELQSVQMQGRWVRVSAAPVRIPLPDSAKDDQRPRNVVFTLQAPLIVPE